MRTITRRSSSTELPPERSAHHIYVQLAWSTLGGLPLLSTDLRGRVEGQLIALCRRLDVEPLAVRASATRVRILVRLKPSHSVSRIAPELKRGSRDALVANGRGLDWSSGYAATSVGSEVVRDVIRRIRRLD